MAELQSVARIDGVNSWKGKGTMAAVAARSVWFMNRSSIPGGSITMVMKSKRKPQQQYLSVRCEAAAAGQSNTNKTGWFIPSIVKRVREAIHRYNEERALRAHIWHVASLITHGVPEPNYDHHYPFAHWVIDEINTRESKNLQLDDIISYESQLCETGKRNMSLLAMDEQGMHIYDVVVRCHDGKEELEYSEIAWQCEETFTQGAETNMQGSQDSSMGM